MDEIKLKEAFQKIKQDIDYIKYELEELKRTLIQNPTHQAYQPTTPTHNPTHHLPLEALKSQNTAFSTGNEGVPTNKPTNQPTNQRIGNEGVANRIDHLERVSEILNSLDALKKEVRIKFKKLTNQEMSVFSAIYELEESGYDVDYLLLSQKCNLSEISIRDYIHKIIKKGIPIDKIKLQNKKIILKIPQDLKKITSLQTIHTLRSI